VQPIQTGSESICTIQSSKSQSYVLVGMPPLAPTASRQSALASPSTSALICVDRTPALRPASASDVITTSTHTPETVGAARSLMTLSSFWRLVTVIDSSTAPPRPPNLTGSRHSLQASVYNWLITQPSAPLAPPPTQAASVISPA